MATPAPEDGASPPLFAAEVVRRLITHGQSPAKELIDLFDAAPATVARATSWLKDRSLIDQRPDLGSSTAGRPTVPFALSRKRAFLGVQIVDYDGSPAELVGVAPDLSGRPIENHEPKRLSLPAQDRADQTHLIRRIAQFITDLSSEVELPVLGAGVAVGGHVQHGVVHLSPGMGWGQLTDWGGEAGGFPLQDLLQRQLDFPIIIDNDITAFTAKLLIADDHQDRADFAVICLLGYGIGGGLVREGQLSRGVHGLAMEPGHLVVEYGDDTPLCRCGNRGCVEAYTAPVKILERIIEGLASTTDAPAMISMRAASLRSGDDTTVSEVFSAAGQALGRGLANIVNIVDPGTIYLFAQPELLRPAEDSAASNWLRTVQTSLQAHAFSTGKQTRLITQAQPLSELEAISAQGAACLCVERLADELGSHRSDHQRENFILDRASDFLAVVQP